MTSMLVRAVSAIVCAAALAMPGAAQGWDDAERWDPGHGEACWFDYGAFTRRDVDVMRERWDAVLEESRASDDEWAGEYVDAYADTSYRKILWAPKAGYAYIFVSTCAAIVLEVGYGKASPSPSLVELVPERLGETRYARMLPTRLVRVRWGGRRCLVPESGLEHFLKSAVGRDERPDRSVYLPTVFVKAGDDGALEGVPVVPPEYRHLVLEPLRAKVVAVERPYVRRTGWNDEAREAVTVVVLDVGAAEGAARGIVFFPAEGDDENWIQAEVVEVAERTSRAEIVGWLDDAEEPGDEPHAKIGAEWRTAPASGP